ncbi:MAG: hypothetical protein LBS29_04980 [Endomicrobium sp.]|jgi:DNA polymerase I-like protein with 3'-5' exonuclease and polymerase domains|nr:hypothetical protein [Endomicrobium sp.]
MLKQGVFVDKSGEAHTLYVQETKGFYRLDIVKPGANYHVDVEAVEFSVVKKRKTLTFGNLGLYEDFRELQNMSTFIHAPINKESYWKDGKFYTVSIQEQIDVSYASKCTHCNGKVEVISVQYGNRTYTLYMIAEYNNVSLDPINVMQYAEDVISLTDTIDVDTPYYPLRILRAKFNLSHLEKRDDVVADSIKIARERLHAIDVAEKEYIGFDTETTGLRVDMLDDDKMVGVVLACNENQSTYFPFRHSEIDNLPLSFLKEIMDVVIKHQDILIMHNGKFDRKVMKKEGYDVRCKWDSLVLSYLVNPVMEKGVHMLKNLMFEYNGLKYLELEDIFVSKQLINFGILPVDIVRLYACPDASNTIAIFKYLYDKLPKYSRNIYEVECDLAHVKADQEYYGLRVDVDSYLKNYDNCEYILDILIRAFRQLTRIDGNINSPAVISDLMYYKMKCPVLVRTKKTGKASTGALAIKKLAKIKMDKESNVADDIVDKFGTVIVKATDLNVAKYPALVILEKYRVYNKLRNSFYARFERTMKSERIFFWINQNGASSGRQSSPMHQLPPELKGTIIADSDTHVMWDIDYSQMELRMIAYLAGEKDLITSFHDPDNDIHRVIGSLITGKEMWEISASERKIGKTRNFGVVYLISEYGLAKQLFGAGAERDKSQLMAAKQSLDDFYNKFKRIRKYVKNNADLVKRDGFITTKFGRDRYFKEIFNPELSSGEKASIIRKANNTPVQGSAADYLKIAETNFDSYIRAKGWDKIREDGLPFVRLALSIHDEVLLMADKSIPYEEILLMIRTCMEIPVKDAPPFFCCPSKVQSWEEHDDDSVVMPVRLRDKLIAEYVKTGVSVLNEENYLGIIHQYRNELLFAYMESLIKEHGSNFSDYIRHPTLTHELLARYELQKGSDMSHEEHIKYAAKMYVEGKEIDKGEMKEVKILSDDFFESLEALVNFDNNGDIIYEIDEEQEDVYDSVTQEDANFIYTMTSGEIIKVWELGDAMCIDVNGLDLAHVNEIIQELWKYREDAGFFKVLLYFNQSIIDAKFRVENIPKEAISKLIISKAG